MASALTHAAVGASIGAILATTRRGRSTKRPWLLPVAGAALGVLPDADVAMHAFVDYAHDFGHRGALHSPVFYAALASFFALLASKGQRLLVFGCAFLALLSHSFLDMLTDGGLGVAALWPALPDRLFLPWRPIPVSPIGVTAFLGEWGLRVLRVEVLFVLPLATLVFWLRRRSREALRPDAIDGPEPPRPIDTGRPES